VIGKQEKEVNVKHKTHKQLADELGVSISTVAIVREVLAATSADSQQARANGSNATEAARWLADHRHRSNVRDEITPEIVAAMSNEGGKGG